MSLWSDDNFLSLVETREFETGEMLGADVLACGGYEDDDFYANQYHY